MAAMRWAGGIATAESNDRGGGDSGFHLPTLGRRARAETPYKKGGESTHSRQSLCNFETAPSNQISRPQYQDEGPGSNPLFRRSRYCGEAANRRG